jgi:class 3 adenylate cyclase
MGEDEEATLSSLSASRKIIDGLIEQHRGRFVGSAGDNVIAEFRTGEMPWQTTEKRLSRF